MDFRPSQQHSDTVDMVSRFVDDEIKPRASEIDDRDEFPADLVEDMAELGLMGMPFPEEYGGAEMDYHTYVSAVEEIARGSGGVGTVVAAHTSLASNMVYEFGDETQRDEYLTPLARGVEIGAFALSEAGAGSDVKAMETTAEPSEDGDSYVVEGGKLWTSNGSVADTVVVFAKTGDQGISSFVMRPDEDEGFVIEGKEDKLGDRGCPTAELSFDEVRIPRERRLGGEGDGFVQALKTLNGGRISIAARSIGIARAALEDALEYSQGREQFGGPISDFQAVQHKLAEMDTKVNAARLLTHRAADLKIRGEDYVKESAEAKLFASRTSREVANEAIQIHGGYGYVKDFDVERYWRDSKINEIYEGTSEVLKNAVARQMLD
ncbi:MAG: acyl-CoA dehydrogenase family protein [Halobacteria archaeon]